MRLSGRNINIYTSSRRLLYALSFVDGSSPPRFEGVWSTGRTEHQLSLTSENRSPVPRQYKERAWDRLNIELRLGQQRNFILVTFNSLGKPFSGNLTTWEMYDLPAHLSADFVRFAFTESPPSWYLDKVDRVMPVLRSVVAMGYQRFVFSGMSAGGYASILFSEMLAREFPSCKVDTVTFNPTLLTSPKYYDELEGISPTIRSTLLTPEAHKLSQIEITDLNEVLALPSAGNVKHEIHYDRLNIFEVYQVERMPDIDRVDFVPHDLNVGHGTGTITIFRSGAIHQAIEKLLIDALKE